MTIEEAIEEAAKAIAEAHSKRSFGLYDYSSYAGDAPPYVVRDEHMGDILLRTNDRAAAEAFFEKCRWEAVASAAAPAIIRACADIAQRVAAEEQGVLPNLSHGIRAGANTAAYRIRALADQIEGK